MDAYFYLFGFFEKFGVDTLATAVVTALFNFLMGKIAARFVKFKKFVSFLTFVFAAALFVVIRWIEGGVLVFNAENLSSGFTAATLSTVITVGVRYFFAHGSPVPTAEILMKETITEFISGVIIAEKREDALNELVELKKVGMITESAVFAILKKYAAVGTDEEDLSAVTKKVALYLAAA